MRTLLVLAAVFAVSGCNSAPKRPTVPSVVPKVIVEYRDLPAWVTVELPLPPVARTVGEHLSREKALESQVREANCRFRVLGLLDREQDVAQDACKAP